MIEMEQYIGIFAIGIIVGLGIAGLIISIS